MGDENGATDDPPPQEKAPIKAHEFFLRKNGRWFEEEEAAETGPSLEARLRTAEENINEKKNDVHEICSDAGERHKWRIHTQRMHPLHAAPKVLRDKYYMPQTSQAFCKFLEILCRYPHLAHGSKGELRSLHLCEAPGHFVLALDRFLAAFHSRKKWAWSANSLNPHFEGMSPCDMLLDDDLVVGFPDRWEFGEDGSGDITKFDASVTDKLAKKGFHLVTADGSLYTQDDPGSQEAIVLPLLKAEASVALKSLNRGGSLVLKLYSLFQPETRDFIRDVAAKFRNVSVFKPLCSKAGNTERYLICSGFEASEAPGASCDSEIALTACEEFFSRKQAEAIEKNIDTFNAIGKVEVNEHRDRMMAAFLKAVHAEHAAVVYRDIIEAPPPERNPWKGMFGTNYVERLRALADHEKAGEFLYDQHRRESQADVLLPLETCEVEWTKEELSFLNLSDPLVRGTFDPEAPPKGVVFGKPPTEIRHSLFTQPDWLFATRQFHPQSIIDLCRPGAGLSDFAKNVRFMIDHNKFRKLPVVLDASQMTSQEDWLVVLQAILRNLERIDSVEIVHGDDQDPPPLILSRFSASVISFLTVLFYKYEMKYGGRVAEFWEPNYPEDIPNEAEEYLKAVATLAQDVLQFVPTSLLSTHHEEIETFNRRQWRQIMERLPFPNPIS